MKTNKTIKKSIIIILFTAIFLTFSCARTVTDRGQTPFLNIEFDITFQGPINPSEINYILAFSKTNSPNITIPTIIPETNDYFPVPGQSHLETDETFINRGSIQAYYERYFYSWSDFIIVRDSSVSLFPSGSSGFDPTTSSNSTYTYSEGFAGKAIHNLTTATTTLHIEFETQYLAGDNSVLYFNFITTEVTDGTQSGYIRDSLERVHNILLKRNEEISLTTEDSIDATPDSADIVSWRVRVF